MYITPELKARLDAYCETLTTKRNTNWPHTIGETFTWDASGRKFIRLVCRGKSQQFVAGFVTADGHLLKSAGWASPQRTPDGFFFSKYNLLDDESFAQLLHECDEHGGHLYGGKRIKV